MNCVIPYQYLFCFFLRFVIIHCAYLGRALRLVAKIGEEAVDFAYLGRLCS